MSSARSLALYRLSRTRSRRSAGLAFGRLTLLLGALWIIVGKDLQGYNMLSSPSPWNPGGGARGLFFLCVLNVLLINAFACLSVARSITEEREAERLGLLRMTGLGPLTILLGKAGARTVDGLELLLVQLPLALLLISAGGVEAREILDLFGLLIAWLLLSTSLATCASVLCRSSRAASGLSALALGALCFLGPLARMAATSASPPSFVPELSPLQLYSDWHFDAGRSSGALPETLLIWLGLALGSLWLSIRLFERRLRAAPPATATRGRRRPAAPAGFAALAWRELHFGLGGPDQLIKQATCYLLLVPLFVAVGVSSENESAALGLLIPIGLLLLPITLALHVSRGLRLEVDSRSLPALAGLPHPLSALLHMKRLGALLNALPCGLLIVIGYVCSDEAASLLSRRHERTFLTINDCVLLSYAVAVIMSTQTSLCVSLWSRSAALLGSALMWWVTFLLTLALTLLGREDAGRRRAGVVYELLDQLGLNGLTLALLGAIAGAAATLALLERASRRRLRQLAAN